MRMIAALFALAFAALLPSAGAVAQEYSGTRTIATESWVEEWDPTTQRWVRVADEPAELLGAAPATTVITTTIVNSVMVERTQTTTEAASSARYAQPLSPPRPAQAIAQYGPFRVLDKRRAAVVGSTDRFSPQFFDAMLDAHPELEVLELVEAPGTRHDIANLAVGRRIRAAGLATHVPEGGSVRSGAVELFLAGTTRTMADSAEFAVHSWRDDYGRQPGDFAEDHPANRLYLDYYVEMGMSEARARDFYAMTNSVPHAGALWLGAEQMRPWAWPEPNPPRVAEPSIDYADLEHAYASLGDIALLDASLDSGPALP